MNLRSSIMRAAAGVALLAGIAIAVLVVTHVNAADGAPAPVYVHMNGSNDFLEPVVAVVPGQQVIFVNQDTGVHTIIGYDPLTGKTEPPIDGSVTGTPGPGHPVDTYAVRFTKIGIYPYYCSVHAILAKTYGSQVQPAHRPGVGGFEGAMAGVIIVTTDRSLLAHDPPTSSKRILSGFFGG